MSKQGFKVQISPAFLKAKIKVILGKAIPKAFTRSALKDLPVFGAFTELGLGVWKFANG